MGPRAAWIPGVAQKKAQREIKGNGPAVVPPDIYHAKALPAPALSLSPWWGLGSPPFQR